jgi:hypothetical protein
VRALMQEIGAPKARDKIRNSSFKK